MTRHRYYVYILTNKSHSSLYVGVTNDLARRVQEHRDGAVEGFSKRYRFHFLVYYEEFDKVDEAILREKQLKKWERAWKERLIREVNPEWKDLAEEGM